MPDPKIEEVYLHPLVSGSIEFDLIPQTLAQEPLFTFQWDYHSFSGGKI
jgi:hypothetical protein